MATYTSVVQLALMLSIHMHEAMIDLPSEPCGNIHYRFLGWIRHPGRFEPVTTSNGDGGLYGSPRGGSHR